MNWTVIAVLPILAAAGLILLGRLPRSLWELAGAALLLGVAGYAWQGRPGLTGAPREAAETAPRFDEDLANAPGAETRQLLDGGTVGGTAPGFQNIGHECRGISLQRLEDDPALRIRSVRVDDLAGSGQEQHLDAAIRKLDRRRQPGDACADDQAPRALFKHSRPPWRYPSKGSGPGPNG